MQTKRQQFIVAIAPLVTILILMSCGAIYTKDGRERGELKFTVQIGTALYLDENPGEAQGAIDMANEMIELIEGGLIVTLDKMETELKRAINYIEKPISRKLMIDGLITSVRGRLDKYAVRIGITDDQLQLDLATLMTWIKMTAELYVRE